MSKSNDAAGATATALLYSGRPDPTWRLSERQLRQLVQIWDALRPSSVPPLRAPPLGYRGCVVRSKTRRHWTAYGGVVAYASANLPVELRVDDARQFESTVLATAPASLRLKHLTRQP